MEPHKTRRVTTLTSQRAHNLFATTVSLRLARRGFRGGPVSWERTRPRPTTMLPVLTLILAATPSMHRCLFISDDHGGALREWRAAAEDAGTSKLTVLHVDAHNDLNVPVRGFAQGHDGVDLANFQLSAVWLGFVSRIVWLRQTDASLDTPCSHTISKLALEPSSGDFDDDPISLRYTYDPAHEREHALGTHTAHGAVSYAFHEVPEHRLGLLFEHSLVRGLLLNASDYILDIDYDFFVHGDARPGRSTRNTSSAFPLLQAQIQGLETFLATVALERPPVAVTLARSSSNYVRVGDVPKLEAAVLAMLERVFGKACITYAQDAAPLR
jgi:hypothetical protein